MEARVLEQHLVARLPELRAFLGALAARDPSPLDPEDLLHDVVERALRYRHSCDAESDPLPWLKRTAFRVFLDQRDAARRRPTTSVDAHLPDPETSAQRRVDEREFVARLLARLPAVEADVLGRFHRGGASIGEIARALGLPEGTVKSHLHRARRRLAETLTDRPTEGAPKERSP